ncbi:hypothetical protein IWQ60_007072 [Tieghemiomyces parasiticus]|uniref:Velvet domain-containing protein n=1 Tax=Tieghemiomyces parasiticus TaxID=78921 RepID=A0A9W8A0Q9_9FUNG|nr:hypothetical protein IWQ60_007072 [Tieghemiomyces parasiticus]
MFHVYFCLNAIPVDRRPIDPPPILQLGFRVPGAHGQADTIDTTALTMPQLFMYVCVLDEGGEQEIYRTKNGKNAILSGSLVSSINYLRDVDDDYSDRRGAFFVFPDLSIRLEGVYRLKFHLYELLDLTVVFRGAIVSNSFTVYSPKRFPGMTESTALSKSFANQGLKIRIRTDLGTRKRPNKARQSVAGISASPYDGSGCSDCRLRAV